MAEYRLLTIWRIKAPQQEVFDLLSDSLRWPEWWPGADKVEELHAGDATGIGSVRRYTWKGNLPYQLRFDALATRIDRPHRLEAHVTGDLEGKGCWTFSNNGGITTVRYAWHVRTRRWWMNLVALATRAVFVRNHHRVMRQAEQGLAQRLGTPLLHADYRDNSRRVSRARRMPDWAAGAMAGLAAGMVATLVQIVLWRFASYSAVDMLSRDVRLAAAISMGPRVLSLSSHLSWSIMLAASGIHFALSILYGLLQAPLTTRLPPCAAVLAGAAFGLLLYAVNMYGFTELFPWFTASRDWITALAHASFGITSALLYKILSVSRYDRRSTDVGYAHRVERF